MSEHATPRFAQKKLIQSRDNAFYKELVKLAGSARSRSKAGKTLLDGIHLLVAYLDAGFKPLHIILSTAALENGEITVLLLQLEDVPITQLDDKLFAALSELKSTTGILTLIDLPHAEPSVCHFALLLEDIQDPGNLGSMLRSAGAAGCDAVFLSPGCTDAWSPKVLRAAMGGHFCLNIHEGQDLPEVAEKFRGMRLAATLQAAHSLYECDLSGNVAFMIGNEGAGLSKALLPHATHAVSIPMPGGIESLNAASAAAICLFEAVRQKLTTPALT